MSTTPLLNVDAKNSGPEAKPADPVEAAQAPDMADPVADMMSAANLLPPEDRLGEFMSRVKSLRFCRMRRTPEGDDHDECNVVDDIDAALREAKKLGISLFDLIPGKKKGQELPLVHWVFLRAMTHDCLLDAEGIKWLVDDKKGGTFECNVIENREEAIEYIVRRAEQLGVSTAGTLRRRVNTPEILLEWKRGVYWYEVTSGCWQSMNETACKRKLMQAGLSDVRPNGSQLSEVESELLNIQDCKGIEWAGRLAGFPAGRLSVNGRSVLVMQGPELMTPGKGRWPVLKKIFRGMLGNQRWYLYYWIKVYVESIRDNRTQHGQMLIFCGPKDCLKSFLQHFVLTPLLGGRECDAHRYLLGNTEFNADLAAAEHLKLDDIKPYGTFLSRHDFAENSKGVVVGKGISIHDKYVTALTLYPRWRLTMSINDDDMAIRNLPDITESFSDKVMLFQCSSFPLPMPNYTPTEKKAFEDTVAAELPHFLEWLLRQEILENFRSNRFGVTHWHAPELLQKLRDMSPEMELSALIDMADLPASDEHWVIKDHGRAWVGTAEELKQHLFNKQSTRRLAEKLLTQNNRCGTLLGKLALADPDKCAEWHHREGENGATQTQTEGGTEAGTEAKIRWRRDWIIKIPEPLMRPNYSESE